MGDAVKQKTGSWRMVLALVVASGLVAAACTNSVEDDSGLPPLTEEDVAAPSPSSSTTTATTVEEDTATTVEEEPEPDLEALERLWGELFDASGLVPDERAPAIAELGDAIPPSVAELVPTLVLADTERSVDTFPVFSARADGSVDIRDCIIYFPQVFESITHVHSGLASPDGDGGWIIDGITRESRGCVPAELNEQVLEHYEEYRLAREEYWNPPDPDHPLIAETLTGDFQDLIRQAVLQFQIDGRSVESPDLENHPEIVLVRTSTRVVLQDCATPDPEGGVFDTSGDRVEGDIPPRPGSRTFWEVTMVLVDGRWKAENVDAEVDVDCQQAPTPAGLPEV